MLRSRIEGEIPAQVASLSRDAEAPLLGVCSAFKTSVFRLCYCVPVADLGEGQRRRDAWRGRDIEDSASPFQRGLFAQGNQLGSGCVESDDSEGFAFRRAIVQLPAQYASAEQGKCGLNSLVKKIRQLDRSKLLQSVIIAIRFLTNLCTDITMPSLSNRILEHASALSEATPLCPGALLHLGSRAAVDQALSRLARSGQIMRIYQGVYMIPIQTRFGPCAPSIEKAIASLSSLWGETIVPCGGAAANALGLTTQNPVRSVYLTSGPSRRLYFGALTAQLRHAPRWQMVAPYRRAGDAVRALAWLGPREIETGINAIMPKLSAEDFDLAAARAVLPAWMAGPLSARFAHG